MVVSINATSDAKTKKVETAKTVFASYRVTVSKNVTDFATTHTCFTIKFDSQSLSRELFFWYIC